MAKPKVTRTYGPIHFEDLDPHRFEDLVRELIYDYKNWQTIEATGRSGADGGFDVRAYERAEDEALGNENADDDVVARHRMEGNLWMIQGKREKAIGPKKMKTILDEIKEEDPPYGYILAASCEFSKKTRDVFRDELKKKGVMEFYMWGRSELEDMLHLPKNDRILFTFFGLSFVSRRRSRVSEIRSTLVIKNKLFRALGGPTEELGDQVLLRDLNDTNYPYEGEYSDFQERPRWRECRSVCHWPLGVWFRVHRHYAYVDRDKKEWDFTSEAELSHYEGGFDEERKKRREDIQRVKRVWEFFRRSSQAELLIDGYVPYEEIKIVDDHGDVFYELPHLYVEFRGDSGPFWARREFLDVDREKIRIDDTWKRVEIFPKTFPTSLVLGKIHKRKKVRLGTESVESFGKYELDFFCDSDGRYSFLNQYDVVSVLSAEGGDLDDVMVQITSDFEIKAVDYVEQSRNSYKRRQVINQQLETEPKKNEVIAVYEFKRIYEWEIEDAMKTKGKK